MAPTEYRVIAKRATLRPFPALRGLVAAGEALTPRCCAPGTRRPGCGSATATARRRPASSPGCRSARRPGPGSMGRALPGVSLDVLDGELVADPATVPTFFVRYLGGEPAPAGPVADGRPRAPRRRRLPLLRGPARRRDHLRRLPDRPVRGRVRAGRPRGGRRGRGRGGARRGARQRRARGRRAARRLRAVRRAGARAAGARQGARPRRTSTRASSTSPTSCRRPRAARSAARHSATG